MENRMEHDLDVGITVSAGASPPRRPGCKDIAKQFCLAGAGGMGGGREIAPYLPSQFGV